MIHKQYANEMYGDTCESIAKSQIEMLTRTNLLTAHSLAVVKAQVRAKYNDVDANKICQIMDDLFNAPALF